MRGVQESLGLFAKLIFYALGGSLGKSLRLWPHVLHWFGAFTRTPWFPHADLRIANAQQGTSTGGPRTKCGLLNISELKSIQWCSICGLWSISAPDQAFLIFFVCSSATLVSQNIIRHRYSNVSDAI